MRDGRSIERGDDGRRTEGRGVCCQGEFVKLLESPVKRGLRGRLQNPKHMCLDGPKIPCHVVAERRGASWLCEGGCKCECEGGCDSQPVEIRPGPDLQESDLSPDSDPDLAESATCRNGEKKTGCHAERVKIREERTRVSEE